MAKKKGQIIVTTKSGKKVRLLTPAEKGGKYAFELKKGERVTNMGEPKYNEDGSPQKLTRAQRAYRAGYLNARGDNAKAYKHNKKKKAEKKTASKK